MGDVEKALATQLANIEKRTGKSLDQLIAMLKASGLSKHGEMVSLLKSELQLGHGDANTVVHFAKAKDKPEPIAEHDPLAAIYAGPKAALRPLHETVLNAMQAFGDFETAPKLKYISYRRKKQFAMIGPATNTKVEVGLNIKDLPEAARLEKLPAGQMCNYRVRIGDLSEVDASLLGWIKAAYDSAG